MNTITRLEFRKMVYEKLGREFPVRTVNPIVDTVFDCMEEILANGDKLHLMNCFSLQPKLRKEKTRMSFKKKCVTPAHYIPYFKPSKRYKDICKEFEVEDADKK